MHAHFWIFDIQQIPIEYHIFSKYFIAREWIRSPFKISYNHMNWFIYSHALKEKDLNLNSLKHSQGFPARAGFHPRTQATKISCAWIFNLINQLELLLRR